MEILPEDFDLAALLAPVPGEAPAGLDLRSDYAPEAVYYKLRDARAEARAAERAADTPDPERDQPDATPYWRTIRSLAEEALSRSKDLEVAAWLTEALLRSDGLLGLAAGAKLMTGLIENFWDNLFPLPDEDGVSTRVAPISGLNGEGRDGTLLQPLRKTLLFNRPDADATPLYFFQHAQVPFETLEREARGTAARESLAALRPQAEMAVSAWSELANAVDGRAGADAPPTTAVADLLDEIRRLVVRLAGDAGDPAAAAAEAGEIVAAGTSGNGAVVAGGSPAAGAVVTVTREDALRTLGQVAEFFRRTEPHSPLAYTLQEAVRRARLSWPELLEEIVPDAGARSTILMMLGIRPPPSE